MYTLAAAGVHYRGREDGMATDKTRVVRLPVTIIERAREAFPEALSDREALERYVRYLEADA